MFQFQTYKRSSFWGEAYYFVLELTKHGYSFYNKVFIYKKAHRCKSELTSVRSTRLNSDLYSKESRYKCFGSAI